MKILKWFTEDDNLFVALIVAVIVFAAVYVAYTALEREKISEEQQSCLEAIAEHFCEERNATFKELGRYPSERAYSHFRCYDEWRQVIRVPFVEEELKGCGR